LWLIEIQALSDDVVTTGERNPVLLACLVGVTDGDVELGLVFVRGLGDLELDVASEVGRLGSQELSHGRTAQEGLDLSHRSLSLHTSDGLNIK
jgi:hypothetical protein